MKNVGIITILDELNYGNRLQNLAMQVLLSELGCQAETIRFLPNNVSPLKCWLLKFRILRWFNMYLHQLFSVGAPVQSLARRRLLAVLAFNKKYVRMSRAIVGEGRNFPVRKYDFFVTGSDQVWNPYFSGPETPSPYAAYLRFAPAEKRLAFAASFGVSQLPQEMEAVVAGYLKDFRFLSVREEDGRAIVKKLTGLDCPVIPDPTLLVDPSYWENLASKAPAPCGSDYILTYFLGNVSPQRRRSIQEYADARGLDVIWMNDVKYPQVFTWGPLEFLAAIRGCSSFFTDSFHGCVFAITFGRQFFALEREDKLASMSGRIATLLDMAGLQDRSVVGDGASLPCPLSEDEFRLAHRRLSECRQQSRDMLATVLGG